jgi:hypothetical protein
MAIPTASVDATIQAAIQTCIRADSTNFTSANVTLGDARGLDKGLETANYVVIYPGASAGARSGDYGQITQVWEVPVVLFNRWKGDDYSTHTAARDDVLDVINSNPTLDGTGGITNAWVSAMTRPQYLYPRSGGDVPTYVLTEFTVTVVCELLYSNTGEFA